MANKAMTLRFYRQSLQDMKALEKINNFRKYGCSSSRDLIIKAVNSYGNSDTRFSEQELSLLADYLSSRINVNVTVPTINEDTSKNDISETNLSKALDFMMAMGGE